MNGGVPSKGLNEQLHDILNQLASNSNLLDNSNNIKYIISLLQAGADPNTKGQDGKTLSHYLDKRLSDILNELEGNGNLLDYYAEHISFLLQTGANRDTQNHAGKTLLHYVAKHNDISGIGFLLGKGADPNVQDKYKRTPLHYAAKNNFFQAIKLLLSTGANPNAQDQSGKTPSEYATEDECRQALKGLGCSSNDKTTCTKLSDSDSDNDNGYYSDDSCKDEGNLATPIVR